MRYAHTWCLTPNVGDAMAPWLVGRLGAYNSAWVPPGFPSQHAVTVGSILNWANEHSIVWGSGLASWKDEVNPKADIRAVRGPLSMMRLRSCGWVQRGTPPAIGDPALLMPLLVKPPAATHGRRGIIPHYVDVARFAETGMDEVELIDPLLPVEEFCTKVASCSSILSSSLHGLIVADAYGIPNAWAKFGDGIGGDGMKYWDYFASVDRTSLEFPPAPHDLRLFGSRQIVESIASYGYRPADQGTIKRMQRGLIDSCPFLKPGILK